MTDEKPMNAGQTCAALLLELLELACERELTPEEWGSLRDVYKPLLERVIRRGR